MTNKVLIEKKGGLFNLRPLYDLFSHSVDGIYQVIVKRLGSHVPTIKMAGYGGASIQCC